MTFNCGFECLWQQWWNGDQRGFIRFNHQSAYPTIHAWSGGRGRGDNKGGGGEDCMKCERMMMDRVRWYDGRRP